jgi:hypothetical protein
MRVS